MAHVTIRNQTCDMMQPLNTHYPIRPMRRHDLQPVLELQNQIYPPAYREPADVFASKLALAAPFCMVVDSANGIVGYLLAHPWLADRPPPLFTTLETLPASPSSLFIHDLALLPTARGRLLAEALLRQSAVAAQASGLTHATLVAIHGAASYWQRRGFSETDVASDAAAGFPGRYGVDAVFMCAELRSLLQANQ